MASLALGGPGHPNEPAGMTPLAVQSFDSLENSYFSASTQGGTNYSIVVDPTSPTGSKNVGQIKFPAGFGSGAAPSAIYSRAAYRSKPRTIYVSFWVKVSKNWVGNAAGANKVLYMRVDGDNRGSFELFAMGGLDPSEQTLAPMIVVQNVVVTPGAGPSGSPSVVLTANQQPYRKSIAIERGVWGHYEVLATMNTPGQADGGIKWWWNGKLYGDYTGHVDWKGSAFTDVYWDPTYGGSGPPVPVDQYMWMKDLYVSGR